MRFFDFVVHDLNNHLHIVNSHILLAKLQADTGNVTDRLTAAETGLQQIEYLVQLLCGKHEEEKQTLSILPFLRAVTKFVLGSSKNIEHRILATGELWPVRFRCQLLLRILANILTNAMEAMPESGMVTVTLENIRSPAARERPEENGSIKVTIGDQGSGIPAEMLSRIFLPGFSTKNSGSGLGLAFCRSMLEKNDGKLEAAQPGDDQPRPPAEPTAGLPEGGAGQQPFDRGRRAAGHGDGDRMADGEQDNQEQPGRYLLLDSDDRQEGRDEAEGAVTGENAVGQPQDKAPPAPFSLNRAMSPPPGREHLAPPSISTATQSRTSPTPMVQ